MLLLPCAEIKEKYERVVSTGPYNRTHFVMTMELSGFAMDDPDGYELFAGKRPRNGEADPYLTVSRLRWMHA